MSTEEQYPEVGDLVVATVTKVVDYGSYVKLDEYENREGLIHISEISSSWVKNIRNFAREGQKLVLKVLRVNPQRNQIDLSLRRVTGREKAEKMLEWKKEKKADLILKTTAEKLNAQPETITVVREALLQKYDTVYDALEEAVEEGEELFQKLNVPQDWIKALYEVAGMKIRLDRAEVKGTVELTCSASDGIGTIKSALTSAKKVRKPRGTEINIYTIGSPKYRIEVVAGDYEQAENVLNEAVRNALTTVKSLGGEGRSLS